MAEPADTCQPIPTLSIPHERNGAVLRFVGEPQALTAATTSANTTKPADVLDTPLA